MPAHQHIYSIHNDHKSQQTPKWLSYTWLSTRKLTSFGLRLGSNHDKSHGNGENNNSCRFKTSFALIKHRVMSQPTIHLFVLVMESNRSNPATCRQTWLDYLSGHCHRFQQCGQCCLYDRFADSMRLALGPVQDSRYKLLSDCPIHYL